MLWDFMNLALDNPDSLVFLEKPEAVLVKERLGSILLSHVGGAVRQNRGCRQGFQVVRLRN